jgi:hypothetical protein
VLWSITAAASGDRELTREEIVELADAVAGDSGVASGIGTTSYGVRLIVEAADRAGALEAGRAAFLAAAERAGLPRWPRAKMTTTVTTVTIWVPKVTRSLMGSG